MRLRDWASAATEPKPEAGRKTFGFNVGGGVMGFFNDVIGLRGDVRYVRSFQDTDDNLVTIDVGNFDYWRANIGVVFRW